MCVWGSYPSQQRCGQHCFSIWPLGRAELGWHGGRFIYKGQRFWAILGLAVLSCVPLVSICVIVKVWRTGHRKRQIYWSANHPKEQSNHSTVFITTWNSPTLPQYSIKFSILLHNLELRGYMNKCQKKAFPKHNVWVKLTTVLPYECKKSTFIFYLARYCYKMLS